VCNGTVNVTTSGVIRKVSMNECVCEDTKRVVNRERISDKNRYAWWYNETRGCHIIVREDDGEESVYCLRGRHRAIYISIL